MKNAKTTTHTPQQFCAVSTEFSLHTDGRWLSVGGNEFDILRTTDMLEAAAWMRARTALNLAFALYLDDHPIMNKSPGSHVIELSPAEEPYAA